MLVGDEAFELLLRAAETDLRLCGEETAEDRAFRSWLLAQRSYPPPPPWPEGPEAFAALASSEATADAVEADHVASLADEEGGSAVVL